MTGQSGSRIAAKILCRYVHSTAMASNLPIPQPPSTPSPPPDIQEDRLAPELPYDPKALSPMPNLAQSERGRGDMAGMAPTSPRSPTFGSFTSLGPDSNTISETVNANPFNFQPMALAKTPVMKSVRL